MDSAATSGYCEAQQRCEELASWSGEPAGQCPSAAVRRPRSAGLRIAAGPPLRLQLWRMADVEGALKRAREEKLGRRRDVRDSHVGPAGAAPARGARLGPRGARASDSPSRAAVARSGSLARGSRRATRPQLVQYQVTADAVTVRQGREKGTGKVGEHRKGAVIDVLRETVGSRDSNGLLVVETVTPPLGAIRGGWVKVNSSTGKELLQLVRKPVRPGEYVVRCRRITREGTSKRSAQREPLEKGDVVRIVDSMMIVEHSAAHGMSKTVRVKCADGRWFTVDKPQIIELLEDHSTGDDWEKDAPEHIGSAGWTASEEMAASGPRPFPPPYKPTLFSEEVGLNGSLDPDGARVATRNNDANRHDEKTYDHADKDIITVTCPADMTPGDLLYVASPEGREIVAQIPAGISAGDDFDVDMTRALTVEEWEGRDWEERGQPAAGAGAIAATATARDIALAAAAATVSSSAGDSVSKLVTREPSLVSDVRNSPKGASGVTETAAAEALPEHDSHGQPDDEQTFRSKIELSHKSEAEAEAGMAASPGLREDEEENGDKALLAGQVSSCVGDGDAPVTISEGVPPAPQQASRRRWWCCVTPLRVAAPVLEGDEEASALVE